MNILGQKSGVDLVSPLPDEQSLNNPQTMYYVQQQQALENQAEQDAALGDTGKMDLPAVGSGWPKAPPTPQPNILQNIGQAASNVGELVDHAASMAWNEFVKMATQKATQAGVPPAAVVSMAAVESARGTSNFARNRNNYFGYQAYDNNPNAAKGYEKPEHSVDEVIAWFKAHPDVMAKANDPVAFLQAVKNNGYATDPNYVQKNISTPEFQHLSKVTPTPKTPVARQQVIPTLPKGVKSPVQAKYK